VESAASPSVRSASRSSIGPRRLQVTPISPRSGSPAQNAPQGTPRQERGTFGGTCGASSHTGIGTSQFEAVGRNFHKPSAIPCYHPLMTESITVTSARTEDLDADTRAAIIRLCVAAHNEEDFRHLFSYIPYGGLHFLVYRGTELVSHAVVTTRWLQPEAQPVLKTAYVDAVATLPAYQEQGYGSALMHRLASDIGEYAIACLETERTAFYEKLGWEVWRGALAGRGERGMIPTPEQTGIMVLRLPQTPALDLNRGLTIECQTERIW